MKKIVIGIFAGFVLLVVARAQNQAALSAQQAPTNQAAQPGLRQIAPGSVIPVQLSKTIDSKKVKPGDEVAAKVTQDMKAQNGEVILPKDTQVIGHVTEAQTRTKQQKESELAIAFDQAVIKNGTDLHLPMSIQAIIAPASPASDRETTGPPPSMPGGMAPGGMPTGGWQSPAAGESPTNNPSKTNQRPPITGKTQGVVGFSNLNLAAAGNTRNGSVISSRKSNVKLESGTLLLLRVS
jgi:3D (Asp-Asp-Asp) domain-containing protein